MFGKNALAHPKDYQGLAADELRITSMFFTLQGEGPFAGYPAVFIRLTGCQLACSFCDTFFTEGEVYKFDAIFEKVHLLQDAFYADRRLPQRSNRGILLVITGGEPLLQKNLSAFLIRAAGRGHKIQIESNGLVFQEIPKTRVTLVISPKVNERTGEYFRIQPHLLMRADCLKFVVNQAMDGYNHIPEFALEHSQNYGVPIYISPMAIYNHEPRKAGGSADLETRSEVDERVSFWTPGLFNVEAMQRNYEYAAFLAMKHQARLGIQMHLFANLP
jgi:organic radical activating enzyme